jgi:hypothetical protein
LSDSSLCRECGGKGYLDDGKKICENCFGLGKLYLRPSKSGEDLKMARSSTIALLLVGLVITAMLLSTGQVKLRWIFIVAFTFIWTYIAYSVSFLVNYGIKFGHLFYRPHIK